MKRQTAGFILMCLGAMGGNSENLVIPLLMIAVGVWLIRSRKERV